MIADERRSLIWWGWVGDHLDDIWQRTVEHVQLTIVALFFGCLISFVLAFIAIRARWTYRPITRFASILYTIPSIALFALLIPFTGLGMLTAEIALVSYTILILVGNTVAGLDAVPASVKEAADGMGYTRTKRLFTVEIPLALPTIIAGIRVASVTVIGLVTVAALVGNGGYGALINDGLRRNFPTPIVVGAVLSITLALLVDGGLALTQRVLTPWRRADPTRAAVVNVVREAIEFLLTPDNWTGPRGILARGWAHIWISLVAVTISALVAIPAAITLAHKRKAPNLSIAMVNLGRAIPSFAIIALVFPFSIRYGFGLGFWPTCIALVALGIPPMFTNAYSGVMESRDDIVEAAAGIGMTGPQVLRKVELPAAVPLLMTGVRVSSVQIVATATLGALVGYECLGTYIVAGLARGPAGRPQVLAGAILVAGLALTVDMVLNSLERVLTPWRRGSAAALA